jgi:hypothetical protein
MLVTNRVQCKTELVSPLEDNMRKPGVSLLMHAVHGVVAVEESWLAGKDFRSLRRYPLTCLMEHIQRSK